MKRSVITVVAVMAALALVATVSPAAEKGKGRRRANAEGAAKEVQKAETGKPEAGKNGWVALFDGTDTKGWHMRNEKEKNNWVAENNELINKATGSDIISDEKLGDCELHVEFSSPPSGNSGVYLQGRYEVQVCDSSRAKAPDPHVCGAVYGRIAPKEIVPQKPGEWQSFDIKFRQAQLGPDGKVAKKARITITHNGVLVIDDAEIDGVTGGAVDNKEGTPASLMLQGDHSAMQYRNVLCRPLKEAAK